jgi:Icc-related predicted phosphoesterase
MKIKVWSDLHLEFGFDPSFLFEGWIDCDVLVLAGDISNSRGAVKSIEYIKSRIPEHVEIVYVLGNHEFYFGSFNKTAEDIKWDLHKKFSEKVHVLHRDVVFIDGVSFGGCVGWCDLSYGEKFYPERISDFRLIDGFNWNECVSVGKEDRKFLETNKSDVVVTHNGCSGQSISPIYADNLLNSFFVNDYSDIIEKNKPKLWIHGHTHSNFEYKLFNTKVVCNPLGYVGENNFFDENFVIEI